MRISLLVLTSLVPGIWATAITSNVRTSNGPIYGSARGAANGVISFKGVPYAAPPVGDLRWKSPREPAQWTTPLDATGFGNVCYEFNPAIMSPGNHSEDCLTVSVWTAARYTQEKHPVMVFIHGGGFQFGAVTQPDYDGTDFAANGVVLVTMNYRLGIFGFLALPELDAEGPNSGNYGIQDQMLALRWVKENACAFGGDPDNVTLFGESAGAFSVGIIMSSTMARGTYDKVIMESGGWFDSPRGSIETFAGARGQGQLLKKVLNSSTVSELRAIPAQTLVRVGSNNQLTGVPGMVPPYSASIDNYVLDAAPPTIWKFGLQAHVPLLVGWNGDEGAIFAGNALPHNTAAEFRHYLPLQFGNKTEIALNNPNLYPANNDTQANFTSINLVGDLIIREQTWEAATTQLQTGQPVYAYYFTYTSPFSPDPIHTAELPFVFANLAPGIGSKGKPDAADAAFVKQVQSYWINFARCSDPNGAGLTYWPPYYGESTNILGLGNTIRQTTYDISRFRFIQSFRDGFGVLPQSWRTINVSEATTH